MKKYIITVPLIVLITILLSTSKLHADEIETIESTETEVIETIETTTEEEIIEETEVSDSTNQSETEVSNEEETTETTSEEEVIEETEEIITYTTESTTFYTSSDWQTFSTIGCGTNYQYCYFAEAGFSQKLWVYNSVYNDKTLYVEASGNPRTLNPGESTFIQCSSNAKSLKFCWYLDSQIVESSGVAIMYATASLENQSSFTPAPDVPPIVETPLPSDPPDDSSDTIINFEVDYTFIALTAIVAVLLLWIVML